MRDRLYISRHLITTQLILSTTLTTFVVGCDSITAGQEEDPAGAPVLLKLMIQDRDRRGGRGLATDLLDIGPSRTCTKLDPCAAGQPECVIAEGMESGVCPDPLKPTETPPAIGIGGNQIRMVFNKLLEPAIDVALMTTPNEIVQLIGPDGTEVDSRKYFDPTGDPYVSSSVIAAPFGPAIVIKNLTPLMAGSTYQIKINTSMIKDRQGNAPSVDINGKSIASYDMTMEGLYANAVSPDFVADPAVMIAPDDYFLIETNGEIDPMTATSTVVTVKNEAGQVVKTRAIPDCAAGSSTFDIIHVDDAGAPAAWPVGTYTISVRVKGDNGTTEITYDVGGTAFDGGFVVSEDASTTNPIDSVVLPKDCE